MLKNILYKAILIGAGIILLTGCIPSSDDGTSAISKLTIENKKSETIAFQVEIADDDAERAQGLMNRAEMPQDSGMLFVFPDEKFRSFWMKNTLIPLDILFIDSKGVVVHIHHHATPHDLTGIPSQMPAMYALEINGGQAASLGIQVGDKVFHNKIKRTLAE